MSPVVLGSAPFSRQAATFVRRRHAIGPHREAAGDPPDRRARAGERLGEDAPRQQGRLLVPRAQRRELPRRTSRPSPRRRSPTTRTRSSSSRPGSSVRVEGTVAESPGKGQSVELRAESVHVYGSSDASYPLQKKAPHLRVPPHHRPPAAAHEQLRRRLPRAQHAGAVRARVFPRQGLLLHPRAHHHGQRRRGRRADVPGHHARRRRTRRAPRAAPSTTRRTSSARRRT